MQVFQVKLTVAGTNNVPEVRTERVIASDWQDVCRIMAEVCNGTMHVIRSMEIRESDSSPFDYKTAGPA